MPRPRIWTLSVKAIRPWRLRRPSPTACTRCLSREPTPLMVALKARPRRLNSRPWPMRSRPMRRYAGRWDEPRMERASKPGQSRTRWGHSARDRWRNREDNSVRVVDHDGWRRYSGSTASQKGTRHGGTLFNGGEDARLVIRHAAYRGG